MRTAILIFVARAVACMPRATTEVPVLTRSAAASRPHVGEVLRWVVGAHPGCCHPEFDLDAALREEVSRVGPACVHILALASAYLLGQLAGPEEAALALATPLDFTEKHHAGHWGVGHLTLILSCASIAAH